MTTDRPFPNWFGHVLRFFLLGLDPFEKTKPQKGNKKFFMATHFRLYFLGHTLSGHSVSLRVWVRHAGFRLAT